MCIRTLSHCVSPLVRPHSVCLSSACCLPISATCRHIRTKEKTEVKNTHHTANETNRHTDRLYSAVSIKLYLNVSVFLSRLFLSWLCVRVHSQIFFLFGSIWKTRRAVLPVPAKRNFNLHTICSLKAAKEDVEKISYRREQKRRKRQPLFARPPFFCRIRTHKKTTTCINQAIDMVWRIHTNRHTPKTESETRLSHIHSHEHQIVQLCEKECAAASDSSVIW